MKLRLALMLALVLSGCSRAALPPPAVASDQPLRAGLDAKGSQAFASSYAPRPDGATALVGATVLTGTGAELRDATVLVRDGRIVAVGSDVAIPADVARIDARGRWVTPGIIDAHSHLGAWSQPDVPAHDDVNEMTDPNTAQVWVEHSIWPQDPGLDTAREAGVTTLQVLPGSANLFGGRSVTLKNVPALTVQAMKFPGAPQGLKIACGENPKRVYGNKGRSPATRMGNVAGFRKAWIDAADYARRWDGWRASRRGDPPKRDLQLETLAGALKGEIPVHNHCYRADDMAVMLQVATEFGFRIAVFHHATEAYKIAPLLAKQQVCVATWANWWGFKMETYDAIEENVAMVDAAGGCAIVHSDDAVLVQHLNHEAAVALAAGRRAGLTISEGQAIRWITANPAKALGILERTGTLEPGKAADMVLWSANPFSIYARVDRVWIDGGTVFARGDPTYRRRSDFLVGQPGQSVPQ